MTEKLEVLHIASFSGNIGDNANHHGLRKKLSDFMGDSISYTNIEMRDFYKSWSVRNFNDTSFISLCNEHDLIIIGGGNFFELKWDYSHTGTTIDLSLDTLSLIKKPVIFYGLGCDVAKGASMSAIQKFNIFLKKALLRENVFISVRNEGSFETLNNLYDYAYEHSISRVPDGAFFYKIVNNNCLKLNTNYHYIGINLVSDMKEIRFDSEISYSEFIEKFSEVINKFLKKNINYHIIMLPHIASDLSAINHFFEYIDDKLLRTRFLVAPCMSSQDYEEIFFQYYLKCELVMGMRFHSNVCAIANNIPTIALSSYKKINDLYKEIEMTQRIVEVNKSNFSKALERKIYQTIQNKYEIKNAYDLLNRKICKQGDEFFNNLLQWFKLVHKCSK